MQEHFSEPPVRFELTAYALRVRCSTPELRRLIANATSTFYSHIFASDGGRRHSASQELFGYGVADGSTAIGLGDGNPLDTREITDPRASGGSPKKA